MPNTTRRAHRSWSIPIGHLAGIQISVHATFLLLILLVAATETRSGGLGLGGGLIWLVAIFACVLVHELAHSVVARAKGATVHAIVLLPIGGVSQIENIPERWSDELEIAAVGPLASIALAILSALAAVAAGASLLPVNIYGGPFLPRLAWLNLLLGLFNLLPAFPLDGGRVLRALLERRRGVADATRIAATAGRALGGLMMVVGLFWDFWLIIIGAFVYMAASQEEQSTTVHMRLRGLQVHQLMRHPVVTIDARRSLPLADTWPGVEVVTVDNRYFGLTDGVRLAATATGTVADVTDRDAPTLDPGEDLGRSGLDRLVGSGYEVLPVVTAGGFVVGVLVLDDVAAWLGYGRSRSPTSLARN